MISCPVLLQARRTRGLRSHNKKGEDAFVLAAGEDLLLFHYVAPVYCIHGQNANRPDSGQQFSIYRRTFLPGQR